MHSATATARTLGLVAVALSFFPAALLASPTKIKTLRVQAMHFEEEGQWDKACDLYEAILQLDRKQAGVQKRYIHCLRRYWQVRRHSDESFVKALSRLEQGQALRLYALFLDTLQRNSIGKSKLRMRQLFRKGLDELRWALRDHDFCENYLPMAKQTDIDAFLASLKVWEHASVSNGREATKHVREICLSAYNFLQLDSTTLVMEFACGACYAVDDYTSYLTPKQIEALYDALKGEIVGVGLTPALEANQLVIADIADFTPAAEVMPPLERGDVLVEIDKKLASSMTPMTAVELLRGPSGTTVEIKVRSMSMGIRTVELRRRPILLSSVSYHLETETVGYIHLSSFHEGTTQELDIALASLEKAGAKALVLDLRGNGGGLFSSAIDVARRFLVSGVITSTQHNDAKFNTVYHARNPDALTIPLVLIVDSDTASAAEVVAGALKENKRAILVGQTTFGKSCTQCLVRFPAIVRGVPTGGLRLTIARYFSPSGAAYTGRGIEPDVAVENLIQQLPQALQEAERMLMP